jgi:hypothetical protein
MFTPGSSIIPTPIPTSPPEEPEDLGPPPQPTTLSGAASSIIDVPRSRRGLGIAIVAAALLVGGTITFVKLSGGGDAKAIAPAAAPVVAVPTPPIKPPPPAVIEPAKPAPVPTPPVEDHVASEVGSATLPPTPIPPAVTVPTAAAVKIDHKKKPPATPAVTHRPPVAKPDPVKPDVKVTKPEPKKNPLIETDID